jgi:polyvinyl alcohol dehydrogenase (cytochrome)
MGSMLGPASAQSSAGGWTAYHGSAVGTGTSAQLASVDTTAPAWTSPTLDGHLYGQPLYFDGKVYVATENDTAYALFASSGAVAWSTHIATPVASSQLPCGNISPSVGITGTPVIDPPRSEIFVVADEASGGIHHVLVGLDTGTGHIERTQSVDPAGADASALLQRSGLNLDGASVVFGFGGNYGDCGPYQGRVVSVPEAGGSAGFFTVDAGHREGAVWMGGGAPAVDGAGHIWVTAGNGSQTSTGDAYDDSDSVLELSASLQLMQYFAPSNWASQNATDADMSTEPALLSDGEVVAAGKAQMAYLLSGSHLGGIAGQQAQLNVSCGDDIDGGMAYVGTTVYLPCQRGPVAIQVGTSPPSLSVAWRSGVGGGPPIATAGRVWTIGQNGTLYGLNPANGAVLQQASVGSLANHFPTPAVGGSYLLVAAAQHVVAFHGTSAVAPLPAPTAPSTTGSPSTTSPRPGSSTIPAGPAGPAT